MARAGVPARSRAPAPSTEFWNQTLHDGWAGRRSRPRSCRRYDWRLAAGARRPSPRRQPRPTASSWPSSTRRPSPSTAGTPTIPGSSSCRTRSPRPSGTTSPPSPRPAAQPADWASPTATRSRSPPTAVERPDGCRCSSSPASTRPPSPSPSAGAAREPSASPRSDRNGSRASRRWRRDAWSAPTPRPWWRWLAPPGLLGPGGDRPSHRRSARAREHPDAPLALRAGASRPGRTRAAADRQRDSPSPTGGSAHGDGSHGDRVPRRAPQSLPRSTRWRPITGAWSSI